MKKAFLFVVALAAIAEVSQGGVDVADILGDPGRSDKTVSHTGFVLGYCQNHRQARWVGYELTREKVETVVADRGENNFFQDRDCFPGLVATLDFQKLDCDRGHLASAADMHWNVEAMRESFYFSNISPQKKEFNRGIWLKLERLVRGFACTEEAIVVVTGPVLPERENVKKGIGERVTVPEKFYKVVYAKNSRKMIGFLIPHNGKNADPKLYACSVDSVEKETGLDFFNQLPVGEQEYMEGSFDLSKWSWIPRDQ